MEIMGYTPGPTPSYRKVMFFIDGGYLRRQLIDVKGDDKFDEKNLPYRLNNEFFSGRISGEIIRVYFYDAICEPEDEKYHVQKEYFDKVNSVEFYEVKLANLVKKGGGRYEQKGVDVLIAVDMISKAYEDHYDIGIVLLGDRDFLPLIKSVKDYTGKRIFGIVFDEHYSIELAREFDKVKIIKQNEIGNLFYR